MDRPTAAQFLTETAPGMPPGALTLRDAIGHAKIAVAEMTQLAIDSIARCGQDEAGTWTVVVDVIESVARMGDNDLLATYEVQIGPGARLVHFARLRRYHREDKEQA